MLRHALVQLDALLSDVPQEALGERTPCELWTVQDLVNHIVAAPARFAQMMRGEPIDWSAPTPAAGNDPAGAFRSHAEELLQAWSGRQEPGGPPVDWQCAELAVHTWDLASALGRPTKDLDPEVAERGLAFMRAGLTDENRSPAFGPEKPAPEGANAYQRIAAFAGRSV
ncbi:MAG: TIGR03086 family protein [Candidatus Dormibacteraeota bacterium]|nr:TIGR03086 family protein [Candidatus Dormibacteraeota bacterium]